MRRILDQETPGTTLEIDAIDHLRWDLERGEDWPTALLKAIALWTLPEETVGDRHYNYFIGGEAFDWLLLAERLCDAVGHLIPQEDKEQLLFSGRFPACFDESQFKELLGVQKHRGYLNFYYGVTIEEALQLAAEREVHKRHLSNGNQYQDDFSEEAFLKIYRESRDTLLEEFRQEMGYPQEEWMSISQSREFTYWLFKYRLRTADKAKIASDTRKGLNQLHELIAVRRLAPIKP
jgi:hypothetical protein